MLTLSGCTIVHLESSGRSEVHAYPGVVRITVDAQSSDMVAYRVRGLGLVPTRNGLTFGWAAEDAAMMSDLSRCRIVLFSLPGKGATDAEFRRLITRNDVCIVGETDAPPKN